MYGHGELLLPIFGSDDIYDQHLPIREYVWDEDNLPEVAVEFPFEHTALFVPGLAAIAPCTSESPNLKLGSQRGWSTSSDDDGVHRATHPHAGAFSYRHNVTYIAVRDIAAGEELTVNCDDDSFEGGAYYLTPYEASKNDNRVTCLDMNLRVEQASKKIPAAGASAVDNNNNKDDPMGMGLFAKRDLAKGDPIISSPLAPIHRDVLKMEAKDLNDQQLMLNYAFGHPDSDLLLLPIGPMVNFINHRRKSEGGANAEIRWHHLSEKSEEDIKEYHDTSLFELSGEAVAQTHGRGLVLDIVALREISEGEEVYLDYGDDWQVAWDAHSALFESMQKRMDARDRAYISADNHNKLEAKEYEKELERMKGTSEIPYARYFRTELEEEKDPYPENLEFFCYYHLPDVEDEDEDESEEMKKTDISVSLLRTAVEEEDDKRFYWGDHSKHNCFRPCALIERWPYEPPDDDEEEDDDSDAEPNEPVYTVELYRGDNRRVQDFCGLSDNYILEDVPYSMIRLLDRPFTTDALGRFAFRHEIGVPESFYPESWMVPKRKIRGRARSPLVDDSPSGYKKTKQEGPATQRGSE